MSLRLSLTYPATDGSMPESVEMEWSDDAPSPAGLMPLLELLLTAPQGRVSYHASEQTLIPETLVQAPKRKNGDDA